MSFESQVAEVGLFDLAEPDIESRRHECEVRDCVKRYYPNGQAMADFLAQVEKARGHAAAEKLRTDVRIAWAARRNDKSRAHLGENE